MTLRDELQGLQSDIGYIQSDITEIKEDLRHHIRRTEILEARQEAFEVLIKDFREASKNIESASLIISKVWRPIVFILCILAGLAGANQIIDCVVKLF